MLLEHKILISHPKCPSGTIFHKAVIYIYQHNEQNGTLGVILNKPSRFTVQDICADKKYPWAGPTPPVYHGGPVNSNALVMLHTDDWASTNTIRSSHNLMISSDNEMLLQLGQNNQPKNWRLFAGLSGWAPGQLEAELSGKWPYKPENSWLIATPTAELLLQTRYNVLWEHAFKISSSQMFAEYF